MIQSDVKCINCESEFTVHSIEENGNTVFILSQSETEEIQEALKSWDINKNEDPKRTMCEYIIFYTGGSIISFKPINLNCKGELINKIEEF